MMDAADLELFERSVRGATERFVGAELDAALAELGWGQAFDDDPRAAVSVLFELQGATNTTSSSLTQVLGSSVLPAIGTWGAPGELVGERVRVRGLAYGLHGDHAVVCATAGEKHVRATVPTGELAVRPVRGLDPWLGLAEVTGEAAAIGVEPVDWDAAVALGHLAVAHELLGASRTMLDLAREHALSRIQFGRPIAEFQAVRHRLADTLVAIETAAAVVDAAWDDGSAGTAAMAKALAGRGARTTARHCQQVLAGIGFTTEHPLHRSVRRVLVLDELLGAARTLTRELGGELLRTRRLPPLLPL